MTDRCEPPPDLRYMHWWHWLKHFEGDFVLAKWNSRSQSWTDLNPASSLAAWGWRYHAPIPDPPAEPYESPQANDDAV